MTLITYDARAHFAAGVTEVAIQAECERLGARRPLLATDLAQRHPETDRRLAAAAGGPAIALDPWDDRETSAQRILGAWQAEGSDALVVAGTAAILATGRKARRRIQAATGGVLPPLFVLPWAEGMPDPCRSLASQTGDLPVDGRRSPPPTAVILDPTLTYGADAAGTASGAATTLARAVEAMASPVFNPSAESLALGAIRRLRRALTIREAGVEEAPWRRELMAAAYDAHLAQSKGGGPVHALSSALLELSMPPADAGALRAALLPAALRRMPPPETAAADLSDALGLSPGADLARGLADLLARLGLPARLSDAGLTRAALAPAATRAAGMGDLWQRVDGRTALALALLNDAL